MLLLSLAAAGCGGGPGNASERGLPALTVQDLGNGRPVNLAQLTPARRPVALWLWGPGCGICRKGATAVDRFAGRERERVDVVGLGSHGSPESAPRFVREHDMRSMRVLWDQDSYAWDKLRVPAEPVVIVFDRSGRELDRWFGPFDEPPRGRARGPRAVEPPHRARALLPRRIRIRGDHALAHRLVDGSPWMGRRASGASWREASSPPAWSR